MTSVYILDRDPDRFQSLTVTREENLDLFIDGFDGRPMADGWSALEVAVLIEEPRDAELPASDFPWLVGSPPVFSARAAEALADLLKGRGELLPLAFEEGEYYAFNVTRLSNALDEERSEFEYYPDGGIMEIVRHTFLPERLVGETIFKLPQSGVYEYVTDPFVERVREAGLTGFLFDRIIWSSKEA